MKRKNRKRSRQEFEANSDEISKTHRRIEDALKEIYENDEVIEPTKKKVRLALQSKLNSSKSYIKKHKALITTLIQKYWLSPPKIAHMNQNSIATQFLSIPDHLQIYVFSMLHPTLIFLSLPVVCKWFHHLLHKESFLHSLCSDTLKLNAQQISTPLRLINIIPFMERCCINCCHYNTLSFESIYGPIYGPNKDSICWINPICKTCFDDHSSLKGISWMFARKKYRLNDMDLFCCKTKSMGNTYVLCSDAIQVAKNKYGDIASIQTLTALDVAEINTQRRACYNKMCSELEEELKLWLSEQELNAADFQLSASDLKVQLTEFLAEYHNGYSFFGGTHCEEIMHKYDRKFMHLIMDTNEIKQRLKTRVAKVKKVKNEIQNMSKDEIFRDIYASSWMDGRFGGSNAW